MGVRSPDPLPVPCGHDDLVQENERLRAELERCERDRNNLNDQLLHQQRLEAAGALAAGLAHDMNNVLAAIYGLAELLLDDSNDERIRGELEQIVQQAERGASLTRSLLAFSRKGQYRKQVLELDAVIKSALPLLAHTLPKSIHVKAQLGTGETRIDGDPVQLVQVLVNFSINAAHAMKNEGALTIATSIVQLGGKGAERLSLAAGAYVKLDVTDTGCGMDASTRARVFEPFFTTKPQGEGTGLGLALVWGVVKGHDGAVEVMSEVGQGSTFSVYLPITTATPIVVAPPRAPRASNKHTVLVVDDEPLVRAGVTRMLERLGYSVLGAANGAEALRVFGTSPGIGLVILDMNMPVMSGAECFAKLRAITSVPVLIATGYALDKDVQLLVARGAALIEKPFSSSALIVEIARLLDQVGRQDRVG
jgi:signal transduction histidine kinase/CheY-like chemotaxis protein